MGVIVLCVDRDDDLGKKARIKGPVIGVNNNIKAATELLLADPEESDANTIFEAVKTFKELKDEAIEVVTITGHASRGYKADKEIRSQLKKVLSKYKKVDGVVLVTDGADDDQIIPVIHSLTRVVSKKTVIIRQAKELEKSYYVLKQLLHEPAFARIVFGLPGIILLVLAFLQELGMKIIIFTIGLYLILKGFGIEEPIINAFRNFKESTSMERVTFPLYVGSFLTFIISIWSGLEKLATAEADLLKQAAAFTSGFLGVFTISLFLFFIGRIGDMHYSKEYHKIKKYLTSMISTLTAVIIIAKVIDFIVGRILFDALLLWVLLAFFFSVVGTNLMKKMYVNKYVAPKLKKELDVYDAEGKRIGEIIEVSKSKRKIGVKTRKGVIRVPFSKIALVTEEFVSISVKV